MPSESSPLVTADGYLYDVADKTVQPGLPTKAVRADSTANYPTNYDVIVVGAGFAGLVAARDLSIQGKNVLLIEARDRIGGRTYTADTLDHSFEMGGTWIHWLQPNVWSEITRYGLKTTIKASTGFEEMDLMTINFASEGPESITLGMEDADTRLLPLMAKFFDVDGWGGKTIFPQPHQPLINKEAVAKWDITVEERVAQLEGVSEKDKAFVLPWLTMNGLSGCDKMGFLGTLRLYALSDYNFNTFIEMSSRWKLSGGTTQLAAAILEDFKGISLFNRPIKSITTSADAVEVITRSGETFSASNVVCTVPLHCLNDVNFSPKIPNYMTSTKHVNMGGKVHLRTGEKVPAWFGVADTASDCIFGFTESFTKSGAANMVIFVSSETMTTKVSVKDEPIAFIDSFTAGLLPPSISLNAANLVWHDWVRDEFSKGSWAMFGPRCLSSDLGKLMKNKMVSDRVFLAGADWADGWVGYIDGAIEQGKEVAFKICSA